MELFIYIKVTGLKSQMRFKAANRDNTMFTT
jgi:hypothetical protein